jgi:hypothetical protein
VGVLGSMFDSECMERIRLHTDYIFTISDIVSAQKLLDGTLRNRNMLGKSEDVWFNEKWNCRPL